MLKRILFAGLCLLSYVGACDVLQWQITGSENVDDEPDLFHFLNADDEVGLRIASYDSQGNFVSYLNPIYGDPDDPYAPPYIDYEFNDQRIGTRDNFWMTRASQALCTSELATELLFQMQLGLYDENDDFVPILYTDAVLVDGKYRYEPGTLMPPSMDWQMQNFYRINPVVPVPEPNSAILMFLGLSYLMLKRKKNKTSCTTF